MAVKKDDGDYFEPHALSSYTGSGSGSSLGPVSGARTQPGPLVVWRVRPTPAVNFLPFFDLTLEVPHFLPTKSDQIRINGVDAFLKMPVLSVLGVGVGVGVGCKEQETRLINF